ncbi:MAG: hypothetical protein WA144_15530 [Candidatus Methanoperedens sp.]
MASVLWLKSTVGEADCVRLQKDHSLFSMAFNRHIIAKGNRIQGIEAKI